MPMVILALTASAARKLEEVGGLAGAVGAVALVFAALTGLGGSRGGAGRLLGVLSGILIAAAFVLFIVGIHYG